MGTTRFQFSLKSVFVAVLWAAIMCGAWTLDLESLPYMETTWYGGPIALAVLTLRIVPIVGVAGAFFGRSAAWMTIACLICAGAWLGLFLLFRLGGGAWSV